MPEGDTLRRLARRIEDRFGGQTVASSIFRHPRLALVDLTGRALTGVDAVGKHLLCRFDDGRTLHVHLLMQGRVAVGTRPDAPEWQRRFEIAFPSGVLTGVDIPLLHLIETRREHEFVGHLGPDLCGPYDHEAAISRLSAAAGLHLSAALLDQRVIAGFGNIYAVETPFICGLSPFVDVGDIAAPDGSGTGLEAIVSIGAALIRTNASLGPQNTTGRKLHLTDHWVLSGNIRRCKICGHRIERVPGNRSPWRRRTAWCPSCQPASATTPDIERAARLLALHPARRMLDLATCTLTADTSQRVVAAPGRRT